MPGNMLEEIERRLKAKTIHDLRQIARAVGVPRPADGRKERILDYVVQIAAGKIDPAEPAVRGAHPKSLEYDRQLVSDILRCREISLSSKSASENQPAEILVSSGAVSDPLDFTASGLLEKTDGKWFLRVNGCKQDFISDIFVNDYFINRYSLREGDLVFGKCKRSSAEELAGLAVVFSVNGIAPDLLSNRLNFETLDPVYPDEQLKIARGSDDLTGRIIDLFSPLGAGQRAVISASRGIGKTAVLKDIALGLQSNYPELKTVILLVDARPEEAADFRRAFSGTDVFISPFDAGAANHVRTARLALEYAKRQTEQNKKVVFLIDGLTKLARAFNCCGKLASQYLGNFALESVKKLLAAAKNSEEGASLTLISTMNTDSDDAFEEAVYSGLKGLFNMRVSLSPYLARMRIYPPIDIEETGAYGDERLLTRNEIRTAVKLRGESTERIFELFGQTENNRELCEKLLR